MNVTLRQMKAFMAVARHASFTAAAEALGLSQPALTLAIGQFEAGLGVKLFDRTTRRVALTAVGAEFLPVASRLLDDFDSAVGDLRAVAEKRRGRLRLMTLPSLAVHLLPPVLRDFRVAHPGVELGLRDGNASGVQRAVARGDVDLGIANRWEEEPELGFQPLLRDPFGLVCRADHPLAQGEAPLPWTALTGEVFLGSAADTGIGPLLRTASALPEEVRQALQAPRYEVSHIATLEGLLRAGLGVAALPALAVPPLGDAGLVFRPLVEPYLEREIALITRRDRSLSPAAAAMASMLRRAAPRRVTKLSIPESMPQALPGGAVPLA